MFERMLIPSIENRITVGVLSFLGIMVLLGWAAINEGGRMQAFTETEHARSIEQGAATFASQCTGCHGPDGRGLTSTAPGLNNPQFFGHDFFPEVTSQIAALEAEKTDLTTESNSPDTTDQRKADIASRIAVIDQQEADLRADRDASVDAAIQAGYNPDHFSRTSTLGWAGTHDSFVLTTLIHGRPVSVNYWPRPMPAWSQIAGGPLRMDQLEDLVAYIENWDKGDGWTLDDLFAVNQFAIEPVENTGGPSVPGVGSDVTTALASLPTGDPAHGEQLYHGDARTQLGKRLACSGCHNQEANAVGPMTNGTFTRVQNERLNDPALAGFTPEQYLVQSILQPGAYTVPGFNPAMPAGLGDQMSPQDLADIVAYLETMNQ